jgi:N-acetylmuramoyl-L-alanine amidase
VIDHPSPNFGPRRDGLRPSLIVLHYTALPDPASALALLCDPAAEVSAHYVLGADGTLWRLVPEEMRAWHAGAGAWGGAGDVNSRSIGIELDNDGASPFPEAQIAALEALLDDIMARWAIPASGVIAHSDLAPDRKRDPGPRFDWRRLARGGRAVWPEAHGAGEFLADALAAGYPADMGEEHVLSAFRQRFRPGAEGPLCAEDRALMAGLAAIDARGRNA